MKVTHVVWVPDSTIGGWERDLENCRGVELVRVCREGEAWPLAAGLLLGGKLPIVIMQCTGIFESGDAMRNVIYDLKLPIFGLIGVRNWLNAASTDSARRFAEPITEAWGLHVRWIKDHHDTPLLESHFAECQRFGKPGVVLMAEGKG